MRITDTYIRDNSVYNRLKGTWERHDKICIAYQFDKVVFPFGLCQDMIELLRRCKDVLRDKVYLYCYTDYGRWYIEKQNVEEYLKENKIPFDNIVDHFGDQMTSLVFDSRAGLRTPYGELNKFLSNVQLGRI